MCGRVIVATTLQLVAGAVHPVAELLAARLAIIRRQGVRIERTDQQIMPTAAVIRPPLLR